MSQNLYLSFLDIQPSLVSSIRLRFYLNENFFVSFPCPGPLKPREGLIIPMVQPHIHHVGVSLVPDFSQAVLVNVGAPAVQQVTLTHHDGQEYTVRVLLVAGPAGIPPHASASPNQVSEIASYVNAPSSIDVLFGVMERVQPGMLDSISHALCTYMNLDRAVIFTSKLALAETGPSRVTTTSECRDLCFPICPIGSWVRAVCRTYLVDEISIQMRPILMELCEESVVLSTKSLADQTTFASLAVRVLTATIDIVTTKFPLPICIAIEEAFRLNLPQLPSGALLGAFLCANLVNTCVAFPDDFQVPVTVESLPLLMRVGQAVVQALIASVDPNVEVGDDISTIVQGLGLEIRNKSVVHFNGLASRCHVPDGMNFGCIEKHPQHANVIEQAGNFLRSALLQFSPDIDPFVQPSTLERESTPVTVQKSVEALPPFVALINQFIKNSLARESSHENHLHQFHQYHLHHFTNSVHHNPQGPSLNSSSTMKSHTGSLKLSQKHFR